MKAAFRVAAALVATAMCSVLTCHAQQAYISRYDVYVGFADIDSPALGLDEKGFHAQAGLNARRWLSIGGDYSVAAGSEILTVNLLPAALQTQINAAQAQFIRLGLLPSGYQLRVPTDASTHTLAFGPQLAYRLSRGTFFLRPSVGALRERAVPHAADAFQRVIVAELAPAGYKLDWTGFYGFGGGGEVTLTRRLAVRAQMDLVYNHPFNDILANGRWTFRYSVGPSIHFGRNIAH